MKRVTFIFAIAGSLVRADSLSDVLARMDQSARVFRSLTANVRQTNYSDILSATDVDNGTFKMMKYGKDKFVFLADFTGKDAHKVHLSGNEVQIYHPKANSVEEYDTRKFTKSVDAYLFVGFGTTSAELQKTYTVTLGGAETIDGIKTTRLDLAPKSAEAKKLFNMMQLWIPDGKSNPIQEKMIEGKKGKDYRLVQFSDLKVRTTSEPALPDSEFELKLGPDVKRIKPGK